MVSSRPSRKRKMCAYWIFPQIDRISPQNTKTFRKINSRSLQFPKCSPIQRCVRRTEDYPILETFLFFITGRRFGGVGASEGLENVPEICTKIFHKKEKVSVSGGICWIHTKNFRKIYQMFPQYIANRGCKPATFWR